MLFEMSRCAPLQTGGKLGLRAIAGLATEHSEGFGARLEGSLASSLMTRAAACMQQCVAEMRGATAAEDAVFDDVVAVLEDPFGAGRRRGRSGTSMVTQQLLYQARQLSA